MNHVGVAALEQHQDYSGAKMGMWLFLFTELLLFGAMFLLYAVYRTDYPQDFHKGARTLNLMTGTLNTMLLLTSSLTAVLALTAIQKANKGLCLALLTATIILGIWFLANKYVEWGEKFHHNLYPGSPYLENAGRGEKLFYGLYYSMTGLHGLHVLVGIGLFVWVMLLVSNRPFAQHRWQPFNQTELHGCRLAVCDQDGKQLWTSEVIDASVKEIYCRINYYPTEKRVRIQDFVALENCALYWHLVDIIWIFLFPLFYLIG